MIRRMQELVEVQGGFKPSVQLPNDFFDEQLNRHFVENYVPTQETIDIFMSVADSLQSNFEKRARSFVGTYGTGKSDLMLMIANYVTRSPDDPLLIPFFKRLRQLNNSKTEAIYNARFQKSPFLLVLLQADTAVTFSSFVLGGLADSLKDKDLENFLGDTYYQAALNQIEIWESNYPDIIQRLSDVLEDDHGRTLKQLKHDLKSSRGDSALENFRLAARKASGTPFQPTAVLERASEGFIDVAKKLVEAGQYSGIFVLADEFTHLLQKLGESPTAGDSKGIDNLAEASVRSGQNQLHFYVVSLQSFASAQGSTQGAQAALERSGGRFVQHELRSQNTEELISASIAKLIPPEQLFDQATGQLDNLLTLAMRLWGNRATGRKDRDWVQDKVVQGCFPLHPLATYCLPKLNAVLAQNERTMFRFIWDRDQGLNRFISEASAEVANGWISLLSLDRLFEYFESTLQEKRPDLLKAYQDTSQTLSAEQIENGIEGRLLRALVMLDVASGDSNLHADQELLRHALGLAPTQMSEVVAALEQLKQSGIAYPNQRGYYQLVKPGHANPLEVRRQIERRAQDLPGSPIDLLNSKYKPEDVEAQQYNSARGTSRHLTATFVSPSWLSSLSSVRQALQEKDGLLCYVIAASEQELEQARSGALQLTREHKQLVVAVPRNQTDLILRFKQKSACEALRENDDYKTQEYQDLLRDTGLMGKDYKTTFENALDSFKQPGNLEWFRSGHTVTVMTSTHLNLQATTVMDEVFSATPTHRTSQHIKPNGKSRYVESVLEKILQSPFQLPAKKGGKKTAEEAIIIDGVEYLGLIHHVKQERGYDTYQVCVPTNQKKHSIAIWLLLHEELQRSIPWSEIANTLKCPPYGLYSSVLQIFLAAFYRHHRDYFEIYTDGLLPIDITAKKIIELIDSPTKFIVLYKPLTDRQRNFLRNIIECVLYPNEELSIQTRETASLRNRVAKSLQMWIRNISILAKQASEEELASVIQDPETISACLAVMETASLPTEAEIATHLLENLPFRLGLPENISQWNDTEIDRAILKLENACQQLRQFSNKLKAQIAGQVGQLFGLHDFSSNWSEVINAVQNWHSQYISVLSQNDLVGNQDALDLLYVLENTQSNFEQTFVDTLTVRWRLAAFEQWDRLSIRDEFIQRLEQAKLALEAKANELVSSAQTTIADAVNSGDNIIVIETASPDANSSATVTDAPVINKNSQTSFPNSTVTSKPSVTNVSNRVPKANADKASYNPRSIKSVNGIPNVSEPDNTSNNNDAMVRSFNEVQFIFNKLSSVDRQVLLQRIKAEYNL